MHDKHQQLIMTAIRGFDTVKYTFGTVKPGSVLPFEFKHNNEGGLYIEAVTPGCGCTEPSLVDKSTIKGTYRIPERNGFAADLTQTTYKKEITVYFDEGSREPIHITKNGIHKLNPKKIAVMVELNATVNLS